MKANVKQRQKQIENCVREAMQAERDRKVFNVIIWFILNALHHAPFNFGKVRLIRVYDCVMNILLKYQDDYTVGYDLEDWAEKMEITEEHFWKRMELESKEEKEG